MQDPAVEAVRRHAVALNLETAAGPLLDAIDPAASLVLIGEASHGTQEFYRIRADLTRALITLRGFTAVAVEADWPDAYRANRWVRHASADDTAEAALGDFIRFPRWMWRNREVVRFLRWLRAENAGRTAEDRVGFYGLDLYSLHRSMACVVEYLDKVDPAGAEQARAPLRVLRRVRGRSADLRLCRLCGLVELLRGRRHRSARRVDTTRGGLRAARRPLGARRTLRRRAERPCRS